MARDFFITEHGVRIVGDNSNAGISILMGSGAPPGTSGDTDDAEIGSIWLRTDAKGELYGKETDTSSASDWVRKVNESIYTAMGIAFDALHMGTYTGVTLTDNQDIKVNIQELETAIEAIQGGAGSTDNIAAGTPTTISKCLVDNCNGVEWEICVFEQASEATKEFFKINCLHNGTSAADATLFKENVFSKRKLADIAGLTFTPKLSGVGAAQDIGLEISATAAITVKSRRTSIP
jgi:hypothetical protein